LRMSTCDKWREDPERGRTVPPQRRARPPNGRRHTEPRHRRCARARAERAAAAAPKSQAPRNRGVDRPGGTAEKAQNTSSTTKARVEPGLRSLSGRLPGP
jgi:hypothetical protein